uniref:Uncharacterized protein n=1 Tax=Strongyloides venezuelensis TaxID=75913 RepID=A0A0K0G490_STRVS
MIENFAKNIVILILIIYPPPSSATGGELKLHMSPNETLTINKIYNVTIHIPVFVYSKNDTIESRVYELYRKEGVEYFKNLKLPIAIIGLGDILKGSSFEFFIISKVEEYQGVKKNISIEKKKKVKNEIKKVAYYAKKIINSTEYKKSIQYFKYGEEKFKELDFVYMEDVLGLDVMYYIASNVHMRYPRELYLLCGESINERPTCRDTFTYLDNLK